MNTHLSKEKFVKNPGFNRTQDDDLRLWSPRVNTAIGGKKIVRALTSVNVSEEVSYKASSLKLFALSDSSLCAIQNCSTTREAWGTLQLR